MGGWMFAHYAFGFDPGWGLADFWLSVEASLSLAVFAMLSDQQDRFQRRQLQYMSDMMEAQMEVLKNLAPDLKEEDVNS